MTPRALRHVFGLVLVCALLLGMLSTPRAKAELGAMANETPGSDNEANEGATEVDVNGDSAQNVTADGPSTAEKPILRANLNITRILEIVEKETPLLGRHNGIAREASTGKIAGGSPQTAGHPLGELRQIFGGAVNVSWVVRIQIVSADGLPVPRATVLIVDNIGNIAREVVTDENGMTPSMVLVEALIDKDGMRGMNPYTVIVDGGCGAQEFPMMVESDGTTIFVIQIPLAGEPLGAIAYAAAALAAIAGCLVTPLSFERTRYALSIPIIPLYSKLRRDEIVGQSTRVRIMDYIELHPGEHFGAIKKALCLSNGNAIYHLRFLEKQGLIKSRLSGIYRRFYARDVMLPPSNDAWQAG